MARHAGTETADRSEILAWDRGRPRPHGLWREHPDCETDAGGDARGPRDAFARKKIFFRVISRISWLTARSMPLRVLILGANGFIGSSLTHAILTQKNWEVYGMDVGSNKLDDSLRDSRFKFVEG